MRRCDFCRVLFGRFLKDMSGAVATEYAFVIAFIAVVAAAGMSVQGVSLRDFFSDIDSALTEMSCTMPSKASDKGKGHSNKCKNKNP